MRSEAVQRVLAHLWALDCNPKGNDERGWDARCPAHEDRNPSMHVGQADDGKALIYCHAGCTLDQIADALRIDVRDLFEPEPDATPPTKPEVVERYDYCDESGELLYQVERMRPKRFRQRRPDGHGGWEYRLGNTRRVIYRLPQVLAAIKAGKHIVIVEGERDVHTLEARGQVATTCPGGAGKWRDHYSAIFKGAEVAIIQDCDPPDKKTGKRPGAEHAQQVRESLEAAGAKVVKVFQPAVGSDITDHVNAGMKLSQILPASQSRKEGLQVLTCREIMQLPDPDVEGYLLGPLIYRGHRIVVGGWTGHGKTTFTLHMTAAACYGRDFLKWHGKGDLRALVVDVEQGRRTVKRRISEAGLEGSEHVKYLRVPDGLALDSDQDAIQMMEKIFATGRFDIVVADPLYKLHRADANDARAATDLMRRFDDWRERYQFALLLPMHCRKPKEGGGGLSPHDLFGSSAWQWGAELLLGVERKPTGNMTWLHWWKDREGEVSEDGAPVGTHWRLRFDRKSGYERYAEKSTPPEPKFDLAQFCYDVIRTQGHVTGEQIKTLLWRDRRVYKMDQIWNALGKLAERGVTHNGAHEKKNRIYQLPVGMLDE